MQRYVAFLRGINLGKRRLPMSRLAALFKALGFERVVTFIASGNVVFSSKRGATGQLETRIARHLESSLGYGVDTFVRTVEEVAKIGREKVFPEDGADGITIHVAFLQQELAPAVARALAAVCTEEDEFRVKGREYYWLCRVRTPDSKVWRRSDIKELRLPTSTMRNIRSIRKLIDAHIC